MPSHRTLLLTALLVALLPPGLARGAAPLADLRDCKVSLHVLMDDTARLQPAYVPERYVPLGWIPGKPFIALWSTACEQVRVRGAAPRPVQLSVAAVAIQHPDRPASEQAAVEMPNLWAHYVHRFHTDDRRLARALTRQGFPASFTPEMEFDRTVAMDAVAPLRPLAESRVRIPGAWSSWTMPLIQHEPPHSHQNSFWYDGPHGPRVLELRVPLAADHFCELSAGERCGTVDAAPGSASARFLGAEHRSADAAVDHDPIARGILFASQP